jgi:hypothetical protein
MKRDIEVIEVTQPIGTFYLGKIDSSVLVKTSFVSRRNHEGGIQRELSQRRISEIKLYCEDPDAAFPTPIIISVKSEDIETSQDLIDKKECESYKENAIYFDDARKDLFEIIDGQHRVEGIKQAQYESGFSCELMVVVMFDLTEEEKAYIFSTINSNQAKVDRSLIYDLFELSSDRSPLKTCHHIARIMNSSADSPFNKKLKMLGKKESAKATLSQGTFVKGLVDLISKNPQKDMIQIKNGMEIKDDERLPLRSLFKNEQDEVILKIIKNYFSAVKAVFSEEWGSEDHILTKTTGYLGFMKAFKYFYDEGIKKGDLTQEFFEKKFRVIRDRFKEKKIELISEQFHSGEQGQNKLRDMLLGME